MINGESRKVDLGIPSYYGGAILTQFGMQGSMDDLTVKYLNHALFEGGEYELEVSTEYNDEGLDWSDKANLTKVRKQEPNDGLFWDKPADVEGVLWGGCVESLIVQSTVGKYLPSNDNLDGTILFIETAEDIPDPWIVDYLLTKPPPADAGVGLIPLSRQRRNAPLVIDAASGG